MNYREYAHHIRNAFPQLDDAGKLNLVLNIRDEAIKLLRPVIAKVPRDMSDNIKAAYKAKGISTEWDLTTTDAYSFFFMARNAGLSSSQLNTAALLYACTEALEENALSDRVRQNILDALGGLDSDALNMGDAFSKAQSVKAKLPRGNILDDDESKTTIGEIIGLLATSFEHNEEGAKELWMPFYSELEKRHLDPKIVDHPHDQKKSYIEYGNGGQKKMTFGQFANTVSNHRTGKNQVSRAINM